MTATKSDLDKVKVGTAALVCCLVRTLDKANPGFQTDFMENLAEAYRHFKDDYDGDATHIFEMINWTRADITGWNPITGQGKPLLEP